MIDSVDILGLTYTIRIVPIIDKDTHTLGQIRYVEQEILLEDGMPEQRSNQTLMHEILHGILEQLGYDDLNENEERVQGIASALYQTLKPFISFSG